MRDVMYYAVARRGLAGQDIGNARPPLAPRIVHILAPVGHRSQADQAISVRQADLTTPFDNDKTPNPWTISPNSLNQS